MTRGRSRRTKWLAMQSPMKEPASVAVITQRASMRRPRPMLAVATIATRSPSRSRRSGIKAEATPPKARTTADLIYKSAQTGTSSKPLRKVLRSTGDMSLALKSTTAAPVATTMMPIAAARRSAYWITPFMSPKHCSAR